MTYPFVLSRSGPIQNQQVGVTFIPWKFFSIDTSFLVGYDKIINMCSPLPNVIEQYKSKSKFIRSNKDFILSCMFQLKDNPEELRELYKLIPKPMKSYHSLNVKL